MDKKEKAPVGFFLFRGKVTEKKDGADRNMTEKLRELEQKIGYHFRDFALLKRAMMHSSYTNEKNLPKYECNERLEFLAMRSWSLYPASFCFGSRRQCRREN